jgi:hypothetical protein
MCLSDPDRVYLPPGKRGVSTHDHPGLGQKLNWLMFAEVNTNGGPSRTLLSVPTVNEPSLPG